MAGNRKSENSRMIEHYLDSVMTESEAGEWLNRCEDNPELAEELYDHFIMDEILRDLSRGGQSNSALAKAVVEVIGYRKPVWVQRHPIAAVALLLLLCPIVFAVSVSLLSPPPSPAPVVIERQIVVKEMVPLRTAILADAAQAIWDKAESGKKTPEIEDDLFEETLRLQSGLAKIRFDCGAVVLLEGPAEVQLLSPERIACLSGLLNAVVPPEAVGFRVDLPETSVIDLGTVFSVEADEKNSAVQVYQGRVALTMPMQNGETLDTGQAVKFFENAAPRYYRCDTSRTERIVSLAEADKTQFGLLYRQDQERRRTSYRVSVPDCRVVSHRGSLPGMVPNTIPAFRKALDRGVGACELDVSPAMDGTLFVVHSQDAFMVTDKKTKTPFMKLSPKEIRRLDAKTRTPSDKGERILTLDEVLSFFREESDCIIVIDVLFDGTEKAVLQAIDRSGIVDRIVVTGGNKDITAAIKSMRPSLCVGYHQARPEENTDQMIDTMKNCSADFLKTDKSNLTPKLLDTCRKHGYPVWCYTIESADEMADCFKKGAAAVMTGKIDTSVPTAERP